MRKGQNGYYAVKLSRKSTDLIRNWCKSIGIECLPAHELHCTMMYCPEGTKGDFTKQIKPNETWVGGVDEQNPITLMGTIGDEWCSIALNIQSGELQELFSKLSEFVAPSKHLYGDLIPHVSLMYNPGAKLIKDVLNMNISDVSIAGHPIEFTGLYNEDLKG